MEKRYDLAVIGAGPAGYEAAAFAGRLGKRTAIIEFGELGGTCLNKGCIPTKALLHASGIYRDARNAAGLGVMVADACYDIEGMHRRKDEVVAKLRRGVEHLLKNDNIDIYIGKATVNSPGIVGVSNAGEYQEIFADRILLATGGKPAMLGFDGSELPGVMTSDELIGQCGRSFSSLVIIGGGVIGLEFASIYANLGSEVTVIEALDRILPTMDPEISQAVAAIMKRRGIRICTSAKLEKIEDVGRLRCSFSEKTRQAAVEADGVLVAAGRKPNIDGLFGLGIEPEMSGGCIKVDDNYKTCIDGIYAVGDVIGGLQLAHLASAQGTAAVAGMFGEKAGIDFSAVPSCVYTEPEIASVGLTLDEAIQRDPGKGSQIPDDF